MRRTLLAAALVACCPPATTGPAAPHPATAARTQHYAVITVGRLAGDGEITIDADNTYHSHFTFNDRGRGPDITATITVDDHGLPRTLHATGHAYQRQPVDETLDATATTLAWKSTAEHGSAPAGSGFYVSLSEGLASAQLLARAALHAPGRRIKLLPAGEAWIEDDRVVPIDVDGTTRQLHEVAIAGQDFTPGLVWLDEHEDVFAQVSAWTSIVATGADKAIPAMLAADNAWLAARAGKLATTLAHHPSGGGFAIKNAAMFDADARVLVPARTIVVTGDRITAIGDDRTPIPAGFTVIDGTGKTVMPGLWDMHVHLGDGGGLLDLACGVTTVRDLGNDITDLGARVARFEAGTELGPRVIRAGLIDGPGKFAAPTGVLASTPDEARAAVTKYADLGYAQIKIYSSVEPALVPIIATAAHDRGLRVSGHVPNKMRASDAVAAGYDEIQHANFLMLQFLVGPDDDTRTPLRFTLVADKGHDLDLDGPDVQQFLDLLAAHHTVLDPTMVTFEGMFVSDPGELDPVTAPYAGRLPAQVERASHGGGLEPHPGQTRASYRASYAKMVELVGRAWKRGIPIVAGTDGSPGLDLARELELDVAAGIPVADVLALATLGAARVMHVDADTGSIEVGKRADLILVNGDPLQNLGALRDLAMVTLRGATYDPRELFAAVGMRAAR